MYGVFGADCVPTMRVATAVPPAVEPVSLAEAKRWLRVEHTDDDADIAALIVEAREKVESDARVSLITQTRTLYLSGFESAWAHLSLPYPPLQSVVSIQYMDMGGTLTAIDSGAYRSTAGSIPGRIWLPFGSVWPLSGPYPDAVQVTYTCGYGDSPDDVPMAGKMAMRSRIVTAYDTRPGMQIIQGGQMDSTLYDSYIRTLSRGSYG